MISLFPNIQANSSVMHVVWVLVISRISSTSVTLMRPQISLRRILETTKTPTYEASLEARSLHNPKRFQVAKFEDYCLSEHCPPQALSRLRVHWNVEQGYNLQQHCYSVHSSFLPICLILVTVYWRSWNLGFYLAWRPKWETGVINLNMLIGYFIDEQGENSLTIRWQPATD